MNKFSIVALRAAKFAGRVHFRSSKGGRVVRGRMAVCGMIPLQLSLLLCIPLHAQQGDRDVAATADNPTNVNAAPAATVASGTPGPLANEASLAPASLPIPTPTPAIELQGAILKTIDATTLAAQVAGPIKELLVKEGDVVTADQALGSIHDEALRLELEQLKTQIAVAEKKQGNNINQRLAEKSQQVASTEYQRALGANARVADTYPINEIDRLRLIADRAALEVERAAYEQELAVFDVMLAQGSYNQAYERYMRHQLSAPAAGVVVSVEKRVGEWVEPGTDLLRIVRIDQLRVEGFIPAAQAHPQLVGQAARVALVGQTEDRSWPGQVVFVSPDANPVNSQVRVFIEMDNAEAALRPGLRVSATIDYQPTAAH